MFTQVGDSVEAEFGSLSLRFFSRQHFGLGGSNSRSTCSEAAVSFPPSLLDSPGGCVSEEDTVRVWRSWLRSWHELESGTAPCSLAGPYCSEVALQDEKRQPLCLLLTIQEPSRCPWVLQRTEPVHPPISF